MNDSSTNPLPSGSTNPLPSSSAHAESSLSSFSSSSSCSCICSVEIDINYVKLIAGDFVTGIARSNTDCEIVPTPFVSPADCTEVLFEGCISFSYIPREGENGSVISLIAGTQPLSQALETSAANAGAICTPSAQSVIIAKVEAIAGVDQAAYCLDTELIVSASLTNDVIPRSGVEWGGDATFQEIDNVTAKARLTSSGNNLRISASIGAQTTPVVTEAFKVVDRKCFVPDSAGKITILPIRVVESTVPPRNAGAVTGMDINPPIEKESSPIVEIDAFCDCDAGVWRCQVISASVRTLQTFKYPSNSVYADIAQASNKTPPDCVTLRRLRLWFENAMATAASVAFEVTPKTVICAHENVHVKHFNEAYPQGYEILRDALDQLSVGLDQFATAKEAKEYFEHRPAFAAARNAFRTKVADLVQPSRQHQPPGPFLEVHAQYLGPILAYVNRVISQVCK